MLDCSRVLVLAPHADDETLGCGGLLSRLSRRPGGPPEARLCLVSNGDVTLHHGTGVSRRVTAPERYREFRRVAEAVGADATCLGFPTRGLADAGHALVAAVEAEVAAYAPACVLVPGPSFHDDHRAVHRAAFAALRPGHCRSVRTVLLYETPYYAWACEGEEFAPNVYARLTQADVEAKLALCGLYPSQRLDTDVARGVVLGHLLRRGLEAEPVPQGPPAHAEAFRLARGFV